MREVPCALETIAPEFERPELALCDLRAREPSLSVCRLSSRSGRIADIVTVDLARPRGAHTRSDARFVEQVERIRQHFLALGVLSET
jgi:hypothetical protein